AADAPVGVEEELELFGDAHCCGSSSEAYAGRSARTTRTAHTLYSGIFEIGSCAEIVSWFTDFGPAQWYGMKIVSGRIVFTTATWSVTLPRRVSALAQSPCASPSDSASRGCSSICGAGYWSISGPMRRVCVPDRNWLTTRP